MERKGGGEGRTRSPWRKSDPSAIRRDYRGGPLGEPSSIGRCSFRSSPSPNSRGPPTRRAGAALPPRIPDSCDAGSCRDTRPSSASCSCTREKRSATWRGLPRVRRIWNKHRSRIHDSKPVNSIISAESYLPNILYLLCSELKKKGGWLTWTAKRIVIKL